MPTKDELDPETLRLLRDYLKAAQEEDRAKKIEEILKMLREQTDWQLKHDAHDKEAFLQIRGDIRGISMRVGTIEDSVDKIREELDHQKEDTLTGLKTELAREKEKKDKRKELREARQYNAAEWLKQNWISILVSILSLALAAYATLRKG
jgi:hypothetical protein